MLNALRVVKQPDKKEIAGGALLKLCAHWESFVDGELVDCANIDSSRLAEFVDAKLPADLSRDMYRAIIFRGGHLDFRSISQLKDFAKKILRDAVNPFRLVAPKTGRRIDEIFAIRNYISHYSYTSKRTVHRIYRHDYKMKKFRERGTFLLADKAKRFVGCFEALISASNEMSDRTGLFVPVLGRVFGCV